MISADLSETDITKFACIRGDRPRRSCWRCRVALPSGSIATMPGVAEDDEDNTDVADLTALAYSLTLRGFDQQQHTLAELRSRTGTLLTASSLLVTFLGALAIDRAGLGPLGIVAIVAYGLSGIVCVWILIPRRFVFRVSGTDLVESQWGLPIDEVHRRLVYWIEGAITENHQVLVVLQRAFKFAAAGMLTEAICWGGQLAGIL